MKSEVLQELQQEVNRIPIADAHEHLFEQRGLLEREVSLLDLLDRCVVKADFVSAGMPADDWIPDDLDLEERWRRVKPYIHRVRNTSYYRHLLLGLRELLGFTDSELTENNWRDLSESIQTATKRPDWYRHVLKEKAQIEVCLLHRTDPEVYDTDREFCLPVFWVDPLLYAYSNQVFLENKEKRQVFRFGREQLEKEHGVCIRSFDDFVTLVGVVFERAEQRGAVAAKSVAAYRRTLRFDPVGRSEAERAFLKSDSEITPSEAKAFQDHAMHLIVQNATEHELPIQLHTGIQHGYGGVLVDSNPLHLTGLLAAHPDARFVLFHGSYPFGGELSVLAKTYANVYLDFSFLPLLSPSVTERNLLEWLDTVPGSKMGWGGDCQHVEELYGHVLGFREVVARVLTEKVQRGDFTEELAMDVARMLLRDNVWEIYDLETKRGDHTLDW
jgi:hypothetical protein